MARPVVEHDGDALSFQPGPRVADIGAVDAVEPFEQVMTSVPRLDLEVSTMSLRGTKSNSQIIAILSD